MDDNSLKYFVRGLTLANILPKNCIWQYFQTQWFIYAAGYKNFILVVESIWTDWHRAVWNWSWSWKPELYTNDMATQSSAIAIESVKVRVALQKRIH